MELIEVVRPAAGRGEHLDVPHSATGLTRGLDHGEQVVVLTDDGEYHAAEVVGLEFEPEDTIYSLRIGARLTPELAAERLSGTALDADQEGVHRVVDLLGELRDRGDG